MIPLRAIGFLSCSVVLANAEPGTSAEGVATNEVWQESASVRLLADQDRISPGSTFTAGLLIRHGAGYHTYWHSPGVVGLATAIEWQLPKGASAGPIVWPGPERSRMADVTVWGYERDVVLMSEIRINPAYLGKTLPLKAKVRWMACASACHPHWADLFLEIPIGPDRLVASDAALIARSRSEIPADLPKDWSFAAFRIEEGDGYRVEALLKGPREADPLGVVFFCDDNQINSNLEQDIRFDSKELKMNFPVSEWAPERADSLSGVLYHPNGWQGLENPWLRVTSAYETTAKSPRKPTTD